jgi:GT2 family glycosyltransferase
MTGTGGVDREHGALDLSVSVVTFDSAPWLPELLDLIRTQTGVSFETFFVDNGSRDTTRAYLARQSLGAVTLHDENVGFGRAHNRNLGRFRGRHVLLLNPDVRFGPELFTRLTAFLDARPDVAIAGPRVLEGAARREFAPRRFYPGEGMVAIEPGLRRREIAWLQGCCLIIRRDVLEKLGGFDPEFFLYTEETDLCLRARRAGYRIGWCDSVEVHHLQDQLLWDAETSERLRQLFRGVATFCEKHYAARDVRRMIRFQHAMCRLLLGAGPALRIAARRWPRLAPQRVRARLDVCRDSMTRHRMRSAALTDLPVRIVLRQLRLLAHGMLHWTLPLDDY